MNVMSSLLHASLQAYRDFAESPHGRMGTATPAGIWDYLVVIVSVIAVLVSLYLCIKYFCHQKEEAEDHIKKRILDDRIATDRDRSHERAR